MDDVVPTNAEADAEWQTMCDMGKLTYLVYDYMKHWRVDDASSLERFLSAQEDNEHLCERDIAMLRGLRDKHPDAKVSSFISNAADMQCAVIENATAKRITVVSRGSESLKDWAINSLVCLTSATSLLPPGGVCHPRARVHRGFLKMVTSEDAVHEIVRHVQSRLGVREASGWRVHFTGHSMGAAVSTLFAYALAKANPDVAIRVSALASPRVGNAAFREEYNACDNIVHRCIQNDDDIVTVLPGYGYVSVGQCIRYTSRGWHTCDNSALSIRHCYSLRDHRCGRYLSVMAGGPAPDLSNGTR